MEAAFAVAGGSGPNRVSIDAYPLPLAMSPHDAVDWMASQAGAGTVVARGDCMIAGGKDAFFESTISATVFPGITKSGGGYSLVLAHGDKLVYLLFLLPADNVDQFVSDVKSIFGSWQWDPA